MIQESSVVYPSIFVYWLDQTSIITPGSAIGYVKAEPREPTPKKSNGARKRSRLPVWNDTIAVAVRQGFSLASAIGHSPKIVPDVREFAVQFGQFVRDDFQKCIRYGNAQCCNSIFVL